MIDNMRLAVLGAGNLGSSLIEGLLAAGAVDGEDIVATVESSESAKALLKRFPIQATAGANRDAAQQADLIIVSVKPTKVGQVLIEISPVLRPDQIIVSFAAAVPLRRIEQWVEQPMAVFRAMPNLAMSVRESATALCPNSNASEEQQRRVEEVFRAVGRVTLASEEQLDAVTALTGSGPAFVCLMMEVLASGGVKAGLPEDIANELARQAVVGASRLVQESGVDPAMLRKQVTTPGGTTAAGLRELERHEFGGAVEAAIEVAAARSRELAEELSGGTD